MAQRAWVAIVAMGVVASGCASTSVTERTIHSAPRILRHEDDPSAPLFTAQWELDGRELSGLITPSGCTLERTWTSRRERTIAKEPNTTIGTSLVVAALMVGIPSAILVVTREGGTEVFGVGLAVGGVLGGVGATTLGMKPSSKSEVVAEEPHRTMSKGPCILPEVLQELGIVAKVGPRKLVHLPVAPDGNAGAIIPDEVALTPGSVIPIVVFRAAGRTDAFRQGQVLGTVQVPRSR